MPSIVLSALYTWTHFYPHKKPIRKLSLLSSYKWRNWDTEKLRKWSKVTEGRQRWDFNPGGQPHKHRIIQLPSEENEVQGQCQTQDWGRRQAVSLSGVRVIWQHPLNPHNKEGVLRGSPEPTLVLMPPPKVLSFLVTATYTPDEVPEHQTPTQVTT